MDISSYQRFGDVIRAIRQHQTLTQRALARLLDVSPGYVGQWECGLSKPSVEIIAKLCALFAIADADGLKRLAFAETAPTYVRSTLLGVQGMAVSGASSLSACEAKIVALVRQLPPDQIPLLMQKLEAWVCACEQTHDKHSA